MSRFAAAVCAALLASSEAVRSNALSADYLVFRQTTGVQRESDHLSFDERAALFQKTLIEVNRHNAKPGRLWTAGINKFADYTDEEYRRLLGHRPHRVQSSGVSLVQEGSLRGGTRPGIDTLTAADSVDWSKLHGDSKVMAAKDQGSCGSCWAVATASVLELHALKANLTVGPVSYEQITDCTPNPKKCGGTGGCKGATGELAMQFVKDHGVVLASDYSGYQTTGNSGASYCNRGANKGKHPVLTVADFVTLERNKAQPLMEALSNYGPAVVSADAGAWNMYKGGVFDECPKDATINHAITAMGYGHDKDLNKDYWLIRNSWGSDYGEDGYIRLLKHADGETYCGTDYDTSKGVACEGDPKTAEVCGMCGILYDSSYPTGVQLITADDDGDGEDDDEDDGEDDDEDDDEDAR